MKLGDENEGRSAYIEQLARKRSTEVVVPGAYTFFRMECATREDTLKGFSF